MFSEYLTSPLRSISCHLRWMSEGGGKRRWRPPSDLFLSLTGELLYGIQPVKLALGAGRRTVHHLYYNQDSPRAEQVAKSGEQAGVPCSRLHRAALDQLCREGDKYKEHNVHQGIVADVSRLYHVPLDYRTPQVIHEVVEPIVRGEEGEGARVWLLLCSIRDPMNLGAILRSSHFLGVDRVMVTGAKCSLSATVSKASSGALEISPVCAVKEAGVLLRELQKEGWKVAALTMHHEDNTFPSYQVGPRRGSSSTVLVVGSEGEGVPQDILDIADEGIHINGNSPAIDSLNASVATAIVLHSLLGPT